MSLKKLENSCFTVELTEKEFWYIMSGFIHLRLEIRSELKNKDLPDWKRKSLAKTLDEIESLEAKLVESRGI